MESIFLLRKSHSSEQAESPDRGLKLSSHPERCVQSMASGFRNPLAARAAQTLHRYRWNRVCMPDKKQCADCAGDTLAIAAVGHTVVLEAHGETGSRKAGSSRTKVN